MTDERNPYRPGVGLEPPYLAGRDAQQDKFKRALRGAPEIPANIRLSGLRGVGKTVLLRRLQDLAEMSDWATVAIEVQPRQNDEHRLQDAIEAQIVDLAGRLSIAEKVRQAAADTVDAVRRIPSVTYEGFEWSLAGDLEQVTKDLGEVLLRGTNAATDAGKNGLVVLLDEAQILTDEKDANGRHPLSTLVAAVSTLQKKGVRLSLVLCGLPTLAVNLLKARTYSERMFQGITLKSLEVPHAREAFMEPLRDSSILATDELLEAVMQEVEGYPYFIQLWGAELWEATRASGLNEMTAATLDLVRDRIYSRLDEDFYEPRIQSLTPAEQDVLQDTAKCPYPPIMVSDLNAQSPKAAGNVNVLLGRLVTANILFRPRKGQYHYTAPGFREFLLRRGDDDLY